MSEKYNKRLVFKKTGGGYERKTYGGMSIKDFKIPVLSHLPTIDMNESKMSGGVAGIPRSDEHQKFGKGLLGSALSSALGSVSAKPTDIFDEINKRLGAMKIKTKKGGGVLEF